MASGSQGCLRSPSDDFCKSQILWVLEEFLEAKRHGVEPSIPRKRARDPPEAEFKNKEEQIIKRWEKPPRLGCRDMVCHGRYMFVTCS